MCYKYYMDTTIRNLDPHEYRALKAYAAMKGKTIGDVLSDAIRAYLARPGELDRRKSLLDLKPEPYPEGTEHLSEEVDRIVYGIKGE